MKSKKKMILSAVVLTLAGFIAVDRGLAQAQSGQQDNVTTGITKPSVSSNLSMYQVGIVYKLPVVDGQAVKKGDLLLEQDNRQEQAEQKALQIDADSDVEIVATDADRKVKEIELKRIQDLAAKGSATPSELEEAQIKVVYGAAQVDLAKLKQQTKKLEAEKQAIKVEQMRLLSPVDGFVQMINVSVGEVTDPQKPVMTVVQKDPLWVEIMLPTTQSTKINVGQTLEVKYPDEQEWQKATVDLRSPVADASSGYQKLRLTLPNPKNHDAGFQVKIKLPPELGAAATPGAAAADSSVPHQ